MSTSIELRSYRAHVRRARIDVDGGALRLVLPGFFGSRPWIIPAGEVCVTDLTSWETNDMDAEVVFRHPVEHREVVTDPAE